jgi:hypothetical protein
VDVASDSNNFADEVVEIEQPSRFDAMPSQPGVQVCAYSFAPSACLFSTIYDGAPFSGFASCA